MCRNSPSPRPAAVPPPSPPPMPVGFVRGFIGTMQPSDFSSAYMPIVRLLPSWAGPECWPDTDEISQVPTTGLHHVHMGSPTARGSSSASHLRGEDVAFRPTTLATLFLAPFKYVPASPETRGLLHRREALMCTQYFHFGLFEGRPGR